MVGYKAPYMVINDNPKSLTNVDGKEPSVTPQAMLYGNCEN